MCLPPPPPPPFSIRKANSSLYSWFCQLVSVCVLPAAPSLSLTIITTPNTKDGSQWWWWWWWWWWWQRSPDCTKKNTTNRTDAHTHTHTADKETEGKRERDMSKDKRTVISHEWIAPSHSLLRIAVVFLATDAAAAADAAVVCWLVPFITNTFYLPFYSLSLSLSLSFSPFILLYRLYLLNIVDPHSHSHSHTHFCCCCCRLITIRK